MKNEKNEMKSKNEKIKVLKFGRGLNKYDLSGLNSIKKNAKVVKSKNKISPKLKRQLLKNYGFFVEGN